MRITILGSGTYQPQLDKANSSYLLNIDSQNIVFDFGRGCINQLLKEGVEYSDVRAIFITHVHADHCCDLSSFLHIALAEPPHTKLRKNDLIIYGPIGIKETINHLLKAFHLTNKKPEFKVIVKELNDGDVVEKDSWKVKCFKVVHSEDLMCVAYRVESNGKSISYSGDSSNCEGLKKCCKDVDLAILEATVPADIDGTGHLSGADAGKIAKEANVKKLVLTHISPYTEKNYDVKEDAERFFGKTVILANDLMKFEL